MADFNILDSLDRIDDPSLGTFSFEDVKEAEEDNTKLNAELDRYKKTTVMRWDIAIFFKWVIAFWLLSVLLILVTNRIASDLSDAVLITLLTTTTVNVLGMMVIILWDLFPGGKQ